MSEPFIAEIRIFAGNFAPRGWTFCDGQTVPIAQNTALFAVIGTTYGGDGRTTLGLPNLKGRAPMHAGTGPGLTRRSVGQVGGAENVTLTAAQVQPHQHLLQTAGNSPASTFIADSNSVISRSVGGTSYNTDDSLPSLATLNSEAIGDAGGGGSHDNMQPYLAMYFIIALVGVFPSRS